MNKQRGTMLALLAATLAIAGCDKMVGLSNSAQNVTKRAYNDSKSAWTDLFTYHPPEPTPLPQTRYCYQMQSDVVCYDSEQTTMTSKLVGYQDGDRISWVQPGGGSLGASGGAPTAYRGSSAPMESQSVVSNDYGVNTGPINTGPAAGQISVNTLPTAK